jgi:hypothetical protein
MRIAIAGLSAALLAACGVEPVRAPEIPAEEAYTATPSVLEGAGAARQRVVAGADIPAQWWTLFRSPSLDRLVRAALADSPTLAKASAKLRGAQEALGAHQGSNWRIDAKLNANRVDVKPESLGTRQLPVEMPLNLYLASVNVSYTFDFFGATRGELEALGAAVDVERFQFEAARQMIAGNVVTTAIRMPRSPSRSPTPSAPWSCSRASSRSWRSSRKRAAWRMPTSFNATKSSRAAAPRCPSSGATSSRRATALRSSWAARRAQRTLRT